VEVHVVSPPERVLPLRPEARGYHSGLLDGIGPGTLYFLRLDGTRDRPDPASRYQPLGVQGPSEVVDPAFPWQDGQWQGLPLSDYIIYELHVGTYTPEGTFASVISHLDELKELGVTALELMPVGQFPGNRNWGYDGVYPFAVQNSYGGPRGLKELVDACHRKGLAVALDVVYNHLGPEGNYLWEFGPYFTDRYRTPWGRAMNFDGPQSDEVRRFFIENALYWIADFHVDALRIDAVHAIVDFSARPFLRELALAVHRQGKRLNRAVFVIAESDLNDTRLIRSPKVGGHGLDAQWNDDFHHSLHALLTGEDSGYYRDFGRFQDLVKAFREGFVYSGQYSFYRQRRHGNSSRGIPSDRFVVFSQNHDQVGNRMKGDRLTGLVSFDELKLAAAVVLFSPFIPLLFMGEEYGETAPFPYFVSHTAPDIIEAVRRGRLDEFSAFQWADKPPDPQAGATFLSAKLNHRLRHAGENRVLALFYKELIGLRKATRLSASSVRGGKRVTPCEPERVLMVSYGRGMDEVLGVFHFGSRAAYLTLPFPEGDWNKEMDSSDQRWLGPGSPVPSLIGSEKGAELSLLPHTFLLFKRGKGK